MTLTIAQRRNLEHIRDLGEAVKRSRAGFWCRKQGLTEFIWHLPDGSVRSTDEIRAMNPPPWEMALLAGERLTDAGRAALAEAETAARDAAPKEIRAS